MSVEVWLILGVLAVFVLFVVAGFIETLDERRPPVRVVQPPRQPMRPYPDLSPRAPWHPEFALARGRRVRAARGRHHLED
ncbi:hypothetical protein ACIQPR_18355 [Streptomyces sp. NPDC091280]|uniref:hypothetical protein n=1 Tax=Streptomyces sp. NPDC091280 TaxID=3365984 RepID=UPI003805A1E8